MCGPTYQRQCCNASVSPTIPGIQAPRFVHYHVLSASLATADSDCTAANGGRLRFRRTSACLSFTAAFYTTGALHVPVSTVIPVPYDRNILSLTAPILHTGSLSALMAPHPSSHLSVFDHRTLQPSESPAGESRAEEDAEDGIPDIADIPISEACIHSHPAPPAPCRSLPTLAQPGGGDRRAGRRTAGLFRLRHAAPPRYAGSSTAASVPPRGCSPRRR